MILQTLSLVRAFILVPYFCVHAAKVLARLCKCAGSFGPSLLVFAKISRAGHYIHILFPFEVCWVKLRELYLKKIFWSLIHDTETGGGINFIHKKEIAHMNMILISYMPIPRRRVKNDSRMLSCCYQPIGCDKISSNTQIVLKSRVGIYDMSVPLFASRGKMFKLFKPWNL